VCLAAAGLLAVAARPAVQYVNSLAGAAHSVIGTLDGYNVHTHMLVVATGEVRRRIVVPARTPLRQGSRMVSADQLSTYAGAKVKIRYTESSGILTAESVMLSPPPAN
jgi:hypothetical protein